jgi:hypothetical protein
VLPFRKKAKLFSTKPTTHIGVLRSFLLINRIVYLIIYTAKKKKENNGSFFRRKKKCRINQNCVQKRRCHFQCCELLPRFEHFKRQFSFTVTTYLLTHTVAHDINRYIITLKKTKLRHPYLTPKVLISLSFLLSVKVTGKTLRVKEGWWKTACYQCGLDGTQNRPFQAGGGGSWAGGLLGQNSVRSVRPDWAHGKNGPKGSGLDW